MPPKMQPNLREWLLPVRKHSGKVCPDQFRKQFGAACASEPVADLIHVASRHNHASTHVITGKSAFPLRASGRNLQHRDHTIP
jgi:hypothetical protein